MHMKQVLAVFLVALAVSAQTSGRRHAVRFPSPAPSSTSFIDKHIDAKLQEARVGAAPIAGDTEFLRRVTLDLAGRIPTPAEVEAFLADTTADKRARKIDELLKSEAFVDRWTMWFGDLVQNVQAADNIREYYLGKNVYYNWIAQSIRDAKPYDAMVRELLAGEGNNFQSGVANYIVRQIQPNGPSQDTLDNLAAHSGEKFLGMPLLCLSCHDGRGHLELVNTYLRNKTRYEFWRMAAFFARTSVRGERYADPNFPNVQIINYTVGQNPIGSYRAITKDGNKSPRIPPDGMSHIVTPAFLTTGEEPRPGEPLRAAYGRMLTADRQFARAAVNYLWKEMFGRGLVEPVNAFDLAKLDSQPSHPALLEELTDTFIAKQYSIRELLRVIALSNAYQRASAYNGTHPDDSLFARRSPRRLMAEVLIDAVATATEVPMNFPVQGMPNVTKAIKLPDPLDARRQPASLLMDHFGRGNRDDVTRTSDGAVSQALALMNDRVVTERVKRANNSLVQKTLAATQDPGTIVDRLYLASLSRRPTPAERQTAVDYLRAGTLAERTEDLHYALLNSLEFLFN
jgi:hypothetical protein